VQMPSTRYAKSADVRVAYQVMGHGPVDLVFVPGFISNLEVHWEDPGFSHLLQRLGSFARVIQFDKRGTGLSDRVDTHRLPNLETRMDDLRAVMDAAGSRRAVLLGASEGGPMSILFAATYPERTRALILYGAYAHFHTWVMDKEALEQFVENLDKAWGTGASVPRFAPEQAKDDRFRNWWARYERLSCSPSAAIALARMNAAIDVRSIVQTIRVPTLIIHRTDDARIKFAGGRYLAQHIKDARFVEIPGRDHPIWTGDVDRVVDEIEEFVTGARPDPSHDRVLATMLIAILVSPGKIAAQLGEQHWRERVERFRQDANDIIARHRGEPISVGTEEIGARFDGPARSVRCALSLCQAAAALKLALASGIHAGEISLQGNRPSGIALHVTHRIAAEARSGDVLVSAVVADLAAGSGLHFVDRGTAQMDGLEHPLRLLSVMQEQHLERVNAVKRTPDLAALSDRENEVLALVAHGLSNAVIAQRLRLSDHTVKRHVANILLKLDLPTRAAAAALAARQST
jgi:pimeloyl-ACP methyl ester carboxylesterase/DNA-binding CsgD family transcriptional regulator